MTLSFLPYPLIFFSFDQPVKLLVIKTIGKNTFKRTARYLENLIFQKANRFILAAQTALDFPFLRKDIGIINVFRQSFKNIFEYLLKNTEKFISTNSKFFASSLWTEREISEMFGVYFTEHLDLRRLLTDYSFRGNPLKKSFPVTGLVQFGFALFLKKTDNLIIKL